MRIPPNFDGEFLDWFRDHTNEAWRRSAMGLSWLAGLSETEIIAIEAEWSIRFPPDYRLFLRRLHTVDRPNPDFYNWLEDRDRLHRALRWPLEGLLFDVEHDMWLKGWGPKPGSLSDRKSHLTELVKRAPRLIPVSAHRYVLSEPCVSGNPVLSVWQGDIIRYGANLRRYFLTEWAHRLRVNKEEHFAADDDWPVDRIHEIPFWGEVIADNEGP